MARKFVHEDGTIKKPRSAAGFRGTVKYAPVSCHASRCHFRLIAKRPYVTSLHKHKWKIKKKIENFRELCRQDDCETWLYMLIELTKGININIILSLRSCVRSL